MTDHPVAAAINELRGEVVKIQHGIGKPDVLKELVLHVSGLGHLEVLDLPHGSAPVSAGAYDAWLQTDEGKKAKKAASLNTEFNSLVTNLAACYRTASTAANDAARKQAGTKAVTLLKAFEDNNKIDKLKRWSSVNAAQASVEAAVKALH